MVTTHGCDVESGLAREGTPIFSEHCQTLLHPSINQPPLPLLDCCVPLGSFLESGPPPPNHAGCSLTFRKSYHKNSLSRVVYQLMRSRRLGLPKLYFVGKHCPFLGCFVSDRGDTRPPRDSGFNEFLRCGKIEGNLETVKWQIRYSIC
ncbi:hypothetical protein L873DRAFT_74065 [Choiromyces venosus 120613-1]|uniref:Uncharacterized protein n=1 Tax=Choiromyces venosus 120613-1 TaxID=1336337 RepID=A0A3N4J5A5_9PEZI|nr:hypothetical protein L873DRAFT_74065 [Choiromyces venosus 120613-1]